jgi:phenylalanine-4-hydroxylase
VKGMNVTGIRNLKGELMLIQFTDCTMTYKDEVLFTPEDGDFDMAVGKEIISAFAGAADYLSFNLVEHELSTLGDVVDISEEDKMLNGFYREVREIREQAANNYAMEKGESRQLLEKEKSQVAYTFNVLKDKFPNDWLLPLEMYELIGTSEILEHLRDLQDKRPEVKHLIESGLELLKE